MREHLLPKSIKKRSFNSVNNKVSRSEIRVNLRLAEQKAAERLIHRGPRESGRRGLQSLRDSLQVLHKSSRLELSSPGIGRPEDG